MTRTKLRDRHLPDYTRGEELVNMISHIVGGGMGVIVLFVCLLLSILQRSAWGIVASAIYGLSFIQLYTISSVYHGLRPGTAKKVLQVLDHCSIYLFIAGTYTPVMLCALRPVHPVWAWSLLGVVWGIAALAITFTAIDLKKYAVFSMICYIGMGWCVIAGIKPVIEVVPAAGLWLLVLGGIVYTLGAVAYGLGKKKRYMHSVFHIFCLLGSVLQALCILLYVL
ncbi:MAG: hemolysin III family protein [Clostridia bacterium]|nr:hemolysin III family protein [Clostridia bacterium]